MQNTAYELYADTEGVDKIDDREYQFMKDADSGISSNIWTSIGLIGLVIGLTAGIVNEHTKKTHQKKRLLSCINNYITIKQFNDNTSIHNNSRSNSLQL